MNAAGKYLRTTDKKELKDLNRAYSQCLNTHFMGQYLKGDNINILEVCKDEYEAMKTKDVEVYGESLPI
jgi:hypothetical protein